MASPVASTTVCLVHEKNGILELHPDGIKLLTSEDLAYKPVAVATVAGLYRTGKSYFLNQLASGEKEKKEGEAEGKGDWSGDFRVGSTTESCTRGIWIRVVEQSSWSIEAFPEARLLLFDTEGLASLDNDEAYDAKIFSLAILLSSLFVYNSVGVIDDAAVDRLILVTELIEAHLNKDEATQVVFPPFMWLLRDFTLELKNSQGELSATEYMERAFEGRAGSSSRVQEYNRVRASFKKLFVDRECCTLVRPANEEADLRNLSSLPASALRSEFKTQLCAIKSQVLGKVRIKELYGEPVTGKVLCNLATTYLETLNGGHLPNVKKAYEYLVESSTNEAFGSGIAQFCKSCAVDSSPLPTLAEFRETMIVARTTCLSVYDAIGFRSTTHHRNKRGELIEAIKKEETKAFRSLELLSKERCVALIRKSLEEQIYAPRMNGDFPIAASAQNMLTRLGKMITSVLEQGEGLKAVRGQCLVESIQGELLEVLRQQWLGTETQLHDTLKKLEVLQGEQEKVVADNKDMEKQVLSLQQDLATLRGKLEVEAAQRRDKEVEVEKLKLRIEEMKTRVREVVDDAQNKENICKTLENNLDTAKTTIATLHAQRLKEKTVTDANTDALQNKLKKKENEKDMLVEALEHMKVALGEETTKATTARQDFLRATSGCVLAKLQLAALEQANHQSHAQTERIAEERNELHERLQDFFLRVSTLPEFYQSQVFCSQAGLVEHW